MYYICTGKMNQKEGNSDCSLLFYTNMSAVNHLPEIEKMLLPLLANDVFLVSMKVKPTNNIKIYLDGDNGLPIEACIKVNRALYKAIEEVGFFPDGDFSLEVSSPGIDEPLKLLRQYKKNIGRSVEVTTIEDEKKEGKLLSASEDEIEIEETSGKGKKAVTTNITIPFNEIKQTKVIIKF